MKQLPFLPAALSLVLTGCTFMGQPSVVSLAKSDLPPKSVPALLKVAGVAAETNAGVNVTVATYNVGRFGDIDVQVIRESLEKEFARISGRAEPRFAVAVVFSRYVQAFSNSHGSLAAVVDYQVVAEGKVVWQDRIFAARDRGLGLTPFGMVKDEFNQRILDRIVGDTIAVAGGGSPKRTFEATFNDLKSVLAILPERIYGQSQALFIGSQPSVPVQWAMLLDVPAVKW